MQTNPNIAFDPDTVPVTVEAAPIKHSGGEAVSVDQLEQQAEVVRAALVPVDYTKARGTCGDERPRVVDEVRPSVFGGPNVYALGIAELSGFFDEDDTSTGKERLVRVTDLIEAAGLKSGGHVKCAANGGFGAWMKIITENPDAIKKYAREQRGEAYDEGAMNEVVANARKVVESKRYEDWSENELRHVLGAQADEAIETLADVPHEAATLARNRIPNTTVHQNEVYERSVVGKGSFVHDDGYADVLEHVVASGADATRMKLVAEHAREAVLAAVAAAVPNPEIYQIDIVAAA